MMYFNAHMKKQDDLRRWKLLKRNTGEADGAEGRLC